ncbi:MAG TPA: helix-turn-helix domain-containing protein, partial [Vicinamibacterales bacterium]|nr:helix-turn-helix domain-containing protein [Vicinamibacterales bacterium]
EGVEAHPALSRLLRRYTHAFFVQVAQNAACNRMHDIVQRCARWLLMTHDRVARDSFELTHHILSQMLGVRRASVTEAALALHELGAIEYRRGVVTILDRAALERASCECYGIIQRNFERLLGEGETTPNPLEGVQVSKDGMSIAGDGTPSVPFGEGLNALS